jgi:hypothetical protein
MDWFRKRAYERHILAFILMIFPAGSLYFSARAGLDGLSLFLLGLIVLGNFLAFVAD